VDPVENPADPSGLLPVESAGVNGAADRVDAGGANRVERSESIEQRRVGSVAVRVVRVLGQDGRNERLDRVGAAHDRRTVALEEPIGEPDRFLSRMHGARIGGGLRRRNWPSKTWIGTMSAR